jgi:hypothetical protein
LQRESHIGRHGAVSNSESLTVNSIPGLRDPPHGRVTK